MSESDGAFVGAHVPGTLHETDYHAVLPSPKGVWTWGQDIQALSRG